MSTVETTPRWRAYLPLGALLLVTLLVYVPSLSDEFVYDDHRFITDNKEIRDLGNFARFFTDIRTMTARHGAPGWDDIYRPLRTLSYAIDWALFGDRVIAYRLENLAWHLVAVFLAWLLLRRILGRPDLATIGAGVFALHPLQTQAVAWVSSRGDLMAAVFVLGASLLLLRERTSLASAIVGVALYALALLGKESAIALLAILPIYDLIMPERPRFRWPLLASLTVTTVLFLVLRFHHATGQVPFHPGALLGAGSATLIMVVQTLLPTRLLPYTGDVLFAPRIDCALGGLSLAAFVLLVLMALVRGRRWRGVAFGILWAAICLAPVSNLVPLKSVAESRFAYLPLIGVGILMALLVDRLDRRGRTLSIVTLLLLAALSVREARFWRSDLDLWTSAVRKEEDYRKPRPGKEFLGGDIALANCGVAAAASGDYERALGYFEKATLLRPNPENWIHVAMTNARLGRHDQALNAARAAYELNPLRVDSAEIFGSFLLVEGKAQEALDVLGPAVARAPRHAAVRGWLGAALLDAGRPREALEQLEGSMALYSGNLWVAHLSAITRIQLGDVRTARDILHPIVKARHDVLPVHATWVGARALLGEAITPEEIQVILDGIDYLVKKEDVRAIQLLRGLWPLHEPRIRHRLVQCLFRLDRREEAEDRLVEMLRLWPDDIDVLANLGIVRVELGRTAEALPLLESAVARDPRSFALHFNLALALRSVGRQEDAQMAARKASALAGDERERSAVIRFLAGR